ncbi:MAG: holo-ACP synthase [Terriglobales bacterium]
MIIKVGTDICSIQRVNDTYTRYGTRFVQRILTAAEQEYVLSKPIHTVQRLAVRFAAKEAASKVLGTGWRGVGWKEIEVTKHSSGEPALKLHGRAAQRAQHLGLTNFEVSLSHEKEYATAFVVGYGQGE